MSRNRSLEALALFEFRRALARPGARMGLILFAAILAVGHVEYWFGDAEPRMFVEASAVGMIGLLCYGLADDRRRHFDRYLIRNHIDAWTYVGAKALAGTGVLLTGAAVALILKIAYSGGDLGASFWALALVLMIGLMTAPLAMAIEGYADTSMPAAFVLLGVPVLLGAIYLVTDSAAMFEMLGFAGIEPGSWRSLAPLTARTLIGVLPAFLIAGALVRLRLRRY